MTENYNYPDTHEMLELHDILEELLSKGEYTMRLGEGSKIYADSSLDFLLRVLFTSVSARCAILSLWEAKIISMNIYWKIFKTELTKAFLLVTLKKSGKNGLRISEKQNIQCFGLQKQ